MRMAGPEESKNERVISDCPDGVCPVPWAVKEEPSPLIDETPIKNYSSSSISKVIETQMHHFDAVERPMHYAAGTIECIDTIEAQLSAEEFRGYLKGNINKYLWREKHKGGIESLKKARWYLDRLIKLGG